MDAGEAQVEAARIEARLRQYVTYVDWAEKLIERRAEAHRFYVTLNLAIVGAMGVLFSNQFGEDGLAVKWVIAAILAFAGLTVSGNWRGIVVSQRKIVAWKFEIIHDLEQKLPSRPYQEEWEKGHETRKKVHTGKLEQRLPSLFMLFFGVGFVVALGAAAVTGLNLSLDSFDNILQWARGLLGQ